MSRNKRPRKPRRSSPTNDSPPRREDPPPPLDRRRALRQAVLGGAVAVGLVVLGIGLTGWWAGRREMADPSERPETPDPRLTYATDYLNVRPDVKYVGDKACAACHEGECSSYEHHPMRRTLQPLAQADAIEALDTRANNPFAQDGLSYEVLRDAGRMTHRETHNGLGPDVAASRDMAYAVGSGNHARSYLFEVDGHLFYSPVTWYSQKRTWGLSPAFRRANKHFSHPVGRECLFCHTSSVEPTGPANNQLRITHHGIGCERCHGPAELHVRRHEQSEDYTGQDYTIVNPAKLEPTLRDAVCEQCHLEGLSNARFPRRGRELDEYRPGLPLHLFIASFAQAAHVGRDVEFVGHVEQMRVSRCYLASEGKLSCVSCHDPHVKPDAAAKVDFYRQRCLNCHTAPETECGEPLERRKARTAQDDCTVCHMPPRDASGLSHVAITDHRVPGRADKFELPKEMAEEHGDTILVNLHAHLLEAGDPEARRDMGIALARFADEGDPRSDDAAQQAISFLREAVGRDDRDVLACEALGRAYTRLGDYQRADAALQLALAVAPDRETARYYAADAAMRGGRASAAVPRFEEVIRINPRHADYRFLLGVAHFDAGAWRKALDQFQKTLEINPFHFGARLSSGDAHVELKEWPAAARHFETILRMDPKNLGARMGMAGGAIGQADYRAAVPWLQQILADQPSQTDARRLLIECYNRLGDTQRAAEEVKRLTPGPEQAR